MGLTIAFLVSTLTFSACHTLNKQNLHANTNTVLSALASSSVSGVTMPDPEDPLDHAPVSPGAMTDNAAPLDHAPVSPGAMTDNAAPLDHAPVSPGTMTDNPAPLDTSAARAPTPALPVIDAETIALLDSTNSAPTVHQPISIDPDEPNLLASSFNHGDTAAYTKAHDDTHNHGCFDCMTALFCMCIDFWFG